LLFVIFTTIFAYIVRIFELPLLEFFAAEFIMIDSYFKALYLTVITITTVGYGDIVPHSYPGKVCMMSAAGFGAISISLIITVVQQHFEFNQRQIKVYRKIHSGRASAKVI
jgi:hypothetical protein